MEEAKKEEAIRARKNRVPLRGGVTQAPWLAGPGTKRYRTKEVPFSPSGHAEGQVRSSDNNVTQMYRGERLRYEQQKLNLAQNMTTKIEARLKSGHFGKGPDLAFCSGGLTELDGA